MIVGIGTDVLRVERMREAIERRGDRILARLFTDAERAYCQGRPRAMEHFAARFAAKEAAMKALGTGWRGGIGWRDIEVRREPSGRPLLHLEAGALARAREIEATTFHVSLTHDGEIAMAVVLFEGV